MHLTLGVPPDRDGHQQPHGRDHRVHERHRLPAPGRIDAYAAGPTAIGVFIGASLGSRLGHRVHLPYLRLLFVAVLLYTAFEMARRALGV